MKQPQQSEPFAICPICGCRSEHSYTVAYDGCTRTFRCSCGVEARVEIQAEPYWMQDVRIAQRRIEAQRAAAASDRACHPTDSSQTVTESE